MTHRTSTRKRDRIAPAIIGAIVYGYMATVAVVAIVAMEVAVIGSALAYGVCGASKRKRR